MAIVGSSVVVGKILVARLPVFLLSALRLGLAGLVLVVLLLAREGVPRVRARDGALLGLQAFAGIFAFNALLLSGLRLTSAAAAGIVTGTTPAVAAALAVVTLGERWDRWRTAAVTLAGAGIAIMAALGPRPTPAGPRPLLGTLLVLGAVIGEATYIVCGRALSRRLTPLAIATAITVLGLAMFLPFALADARGTDLATLGAREWLALAYYALAVTVLAFVLWARGVARVPAGTAAVFTGVLPVSAVATSALLLGEPVRLAHVAGVACVVVAIGLLARTG